MNSMKQKNVRTGMGVQKSQYAPNLQAWQVQEEDFPQDVTCREQLEYLIRYGVLAANSHNTQPWTFCVRDSSIEVYWDESRALPLSDPTLRQGMISLGCALGNLVVAGEYFGFAPQITYVGQKGENGSPVAVVALEKRVTHAPLHGTLFKALIERRINRFPYDRKRFIAKETLAALSATSLVEGVTITFVDKALQRECMVAAVYHSTVGTQGNMQIVEEWSKWMRPRNTPLYDGLPLTEDFGFPGPLASIAPLVWRLTPGRVQAHNTRKLFATAPAFFVISGPDSQQHWLQAGQALTYLALAATQQGIAYAPWGAVVEYQPSADLVRDMLHLSPAERVLFFGRLGYAKKVPPVHSPRRPVEDVLREHEYTPFESTSTEMQV